MLAGPWAEFTGLSSAIPRVDATFQRTGPYALRFPSSAATSLDAYARRLFGANKATVGVGFGLYMPGIPAANGRIGFQLRNNANAAVLTFAFQSDASIEVFRGTAAGTSIGRTGQVLTALAWNHIEVRAHRDAAAGSVEIRINGVTELDLSGVDTGATDFAGLLAGKIATGSVAWYEMAIDDLFAWDTSGGQNNDFLGPQRCYRLLPDGDTVQADWTATGAATGHEAIDDVPPDGDTSYIAAASVNDVSEFDLEDLPAEVTAVTALYVTPMLRKLDAGTANVQASIISGASAAAGADRPITEVYTYWPDIVELDPDTGAPWTAAAVNAAKLRLEKTA